MFGLSDAVLLALIATIVPTLTAVFSMIQSLRTQSRLDQMHSYKLGADDGREHKQRASDRETAERPHAGDVAARAREAQAATDTTVRFADEVAAQDRRGRTHEG